MITIVSGLPRSGTSLMMRLLEKGGIPPLEDHIRTADDDNPLGYYEFEKVKSLKSDASFLDEAEGRAVKMVAKLLCDLPPDRACAVVFMERDLRETIASQNKMLARQGKTNPIDDARLIEIYSKHLAEISTWLSKRANISVIRISYNALLSEPTAEIDRLIAFLGRPLDRNAMLGAIDPKLYRNRAR